MTANTPRGTAPTQYDGSGPAVDAQTNVITDGHTVFLVFHEQVSELVTPEIIEADRLQEMRRPDTAPIVTHEVFGGILSPLHRRHRPGEERSQPA
jgi:hypothetical protein